MKLANNNEQKSVEYTDVNVNYSQGEEEWKVSNSMHILRGCNSPTLPLTLFYRRNMSK